MKQKHLSMCDRIIEHLTTGKVQLTEREQEHLDRIHFAYDNYDRYPSPRKLIKLIMNKFDLTERQANLVYQDFFIVYGKTTPKQTRAVALGILLQRISDTYNNAVLMRDFATAARCNDQYIKLIEKYFPGESDSLDIEDNLPVYQLVFDEALLLGANYDRKSLEQLKIQAKKLLEYEEAKIVSE